MKPFCYTLESISRLTDQQIRILLDKPEPEATVPASQEEIMKAIWRRRGKPESELPRLWAEHQKKAKVNGQAMESRHGVCRDSGEGQDC
jgi:hypothetical protein